MLGPFGKGRGAGARGARGCTKNPMSAYPSDTDTGESSNESAQGFNAARNTVSAAEPAIVVEVQRSPGGRNESASGGKGKPVNWYGAGKWRYESAITSPRHFLSLGRSGGRGGKGGNSGKGGNGGKGGKPPPPPQRPVPASSSTCRAPLEVHHDDVEVLHAQLLAELQGKAESRMTHEQMARSNERPGNDESQMRQLSINISKAGRTDKLLWLAESNMDSLKARHLANLWNKLGRQQDTSDHRHRPQIRLLLLRTIELMHTCEIPQLANIAHGAARCRVQDARTLYAAVAEAAVRVGLCNSKPQELANMAWGFAKAGVRADALFAAVEEEAVRRGLGEFKPQELANTAWAFTTAGVCADALFAAVAEMAVRRGLGEFKPQELSSMAWAFAKVGVRADALFAAVAREAVARRLDGFNPQALSNVAWAFATAGVPADALYAEVAEATIRGALGSFFPQNFSNIVWAFATAGVRADEMYATVADALMRNGLAGFKPQEIANTLWGFAKAGVRAEAMYRAVEEAILRGGLGGFKPQDCSNMVWAFATADVCADTLFVAVADEVVRGGLGQFTLQELSISVWAFAKVGVRVDALFAAVAEMAVRRGLGEFKPQELSSMAWAFAKVGVRADALFAAVEQEAVRRGVGGFTPQALSNIAWAFVTEGVYAPQLFTRLVPAVVLSFSHSPSEWGVAELAELHQWQLQLMLDSHVSASLLLPEDLRHRCRNAMVDSQSHTSQLQHSVARALAAVHAGFEEEVIDDWTGYSLDLALRSRFVAIDVDGPHHFLRDPHAPGKYIPSGPTLFKRRLLHTVGWRLVNVPFYEWDALSSYQAQQEYLKSRLSEAT